MPAKRSNVAFETELVASDSEKVSVTTAFKPTSTVPEAGVTLITVGAVVSGAFAVVNERGVNGSTLPA